MRRALLRFIPVLLAGAWLLVRAPLLAAQTSVDVQIGNVTFSKLADWQRGTLDGLLISNNADGELRLADTAKSGTFTSDVVRTLASERKAQPVNAEAIARAHEAFADEECRNAHCGKRVQIGI